MAGYDHSQRRQLESFDDKYLEWYDSRRRIRRTSAKSRAQAGANLYDIVDMIEILLRSYQSKFSINNDYPWVLVFPYLFVKPDPGDKIINKTTNEEYTILAVEQLDHLNKRNVPYPLAKSPSRDSFSGRIVLREGQSAPTKYDKLEFKDSNKNYINFFEWGSRRDASKPVGSHADASEQQNGPFLPTITWHVKRVEPGTVGKKPFDPDKEVKPRIREQFPDPDRTYLIPTDDQINAGFLKSTYPIGTGWGDTGAIYTGFTSYRILSETEQSPLLSTHTITVYGQYFDNIVQFDAWSDNNQEASALVAWFEDFMDLYTNVLRRNGVVEVLYWQRLVDEKIERWRNDIDNRTIQYYFRTEKLKVDRSSNFRKFDIRVIVSHDPSTTLLYGEPTGIGTTTGAWGYGSTGVNYNFGSGVYYTGDGTYNWGRLIIRE